jgi:glutamate-1-semialdehyde aminotransferase
MDVLESKVFVSSTFFPNSLEMAAALKCIEILERDQVIDDIYKKGERFLSECERLVEKYDVPATVSGIPPMPYITFDKCANYKERRTRFYTETIRRGLFIQPYHHGYIAYRHTEADIDKALNAIEEALAIVAEVYPEK